MSDPGTAQSASCMDQVKAYVRTRKGIVLATEIVFCIIVLICYAASRHPGYLGVAITELVFSTVFFFLFALRYDQQFAFIHWGWTDFLRAALGAALFIILCIICLIRGGDGAGIAGSVIGLLTGVLLAYDAFLTFPKLRRTHAPAATESPDNI
ncbi:PREDICTED: proteolipid protein 2 [Nanorana parkeri]|uniref:proteolipid protein 2 n=1 Tax=Nanorana parkeri TaxID=125878 RepID=UPI0008543027|nr:PREDICTED: proteolipid protein 2 [Nanorana parkeri]